MKPSEVIREARSILFERGWHQGGYQGRDGSVCVEGACLLALETLPGALSEADTLSTIRAVLPSSFCAVFLWNDDEDTTFSDVIDVLDRAEKIAEEREANV